MALWSSSEGVGGVVWVFLVEPVDVPVLRSNHA